MKTWINALIVDDDLGYAQVLMEDAKAYNINLMHALYWEDAKERISHGRGDYDVIVLDGKGQISATSKAEDLNHLKQAQIDLAELRGKGIAIPFLVLTGFVDSNIVAHDVQVFRKGTQEKDMFAKIRELADQSPSYRLRTSYPDIIPLFEASKMGKTAESYFLELFSQIESPKTIIPDPRNTIRKLIEAFCKQAAEIGILDPRLAPPNKTPNLTSCRILIIDPNRQVSYPTTQNKQYEIWLDPNPFPEFVKSSLHFLLQNTPSGSHYIPGDLCSHRLAKALFHALTVILSWIQKYAIDHPDFKENSKCIQSKPV